MNVASKEHAFSWHIETPEKQNFQLSLQTFLVKSTVLGNKMVHYQYLNQGKFACFYNTWARFDGLLGYDSVQPLIL